MIKIPKKLIEKAFGRKVKPNVDCLGVDTASRTGWCAISTGLAEIDFVTAEFGFIDLKTPNKYFKYDKYIELFNQILVPDTKIVIEESFFGRNAKVFQMLSRLGGFVYAVAHLKGIRDKSFILATSARKQLGFKGNAKKAIIQKEFLKKTKLDIDDEDIIDAFVLAFTGVLEDKYEEDRPTKKRTK